MSNISCCLKINHRFASGIVFNIERGLILTIMSGSLAQIHHSKCSVWMQLGARHNYSIFEFEAEVLNHFMLTFNNEIVIRLKPILYLISLKSCSLTQDDLLFKKTFAQFSCSPVCQGDGVLVVGSPFGPACPPVLLNNHFKGIVSKTCGYTVSMLLIDTFCPKGLTGAPVFILKNNEYFFYGLLLTDCSEFNKFSSHIDFGTIFPVISIVNLFTELTIFTTLKIFEYDSFLHLTRYTSIINPIEFSPNSSLLPASILSRIVRIEANSTFGTGIMITDSVCITCAHVVANVCLNDLVEVSRINSSNVCLNFFLSFTSKPNLYPDIAILVKSKYDLVQNHQLMNDMVCNKRIITEGDEILGISYGRFTYSEKVSSPLLTAGCVSHIVRDKGDIVFGQITCCLSEGGSGGLVVDKQSFIFLGIFFGFAKEQKEAVTHYYPQISRFIPLQVICDLWRKGLEDSCNSLEINIYVQTLWNYGYRMFMPNSNL